jgi:hypothetical protein
LRHETMEGQFMRALLDIGDFDSLFANAQQSFDHAFDGPPRIASAGRPGLAMKVQTLRASATSQTNHKPRSTYKHNKQMKPQSNALLFSVRKIAITLERTLNPSLRAMATCWCVLGLALGAGTARAEVTSVTIHLSEPFEEASGYTYAEATMNGTVDRDDGTSGTYSVPMVLIYPEDGGNGVGVVDWPNGGYYHVTGFSDLDESMTIQYARRTTDGYLFDNGFTYASVQWSKMVTELFADVPLEPDSNHLVRGTIENGGDAFEILRDAAHFLRDPSAVAGPSPVDTVLSSGFAATAGLQLGFLSQGENIVDGVPVYDGHLIGKFGLCVTPNDVPPIYDSSVPCAPIDSSAHPDSPVIVIQTQSDLEGLFAAFVRNPDNPNWRQYELPGVSTLPTPIFPGISDLQNPISSKPVFRAAFRNLTLWVTEGIAPPPSRFMDGELEDGLLTPNMDLDGNATGGLRLPHMEQIINGRVAGAPLGTYTGLNPAGFPPDLDILLLFSGLFIPFTAEELAERYPTHGAYVRRVARAAEHLAENGYILEEDKNAYVIDAAQTDATPSRGPGRSQR